MDFNRRKAAILFFIYSAGRSISPTDLVINQGITIYNACVKLKKMAGQGYLRKRGRGKYALAAKGERIRIRLRNRIQVQQVTGTKISLNLKKSVPYEVQKMYREITGESPVGL